MRLAARSYLPFLDLLESRLQPGSVLNGSLNLSLLAGDLGLLSSGLFASLEGATVGAQPIQSPPLNNVSIQDRTDFRAIVPDMPLDVTPPLAVKPPTTETIQAIQNTVAVQPLQGTSSRR